MDIVPRYVEKCKGKSTKSEKFFNLGNNTLQIGAGLFGRCEHVGKETAQILLKLCWQNGARCLAQGNQTLFAWMGLTVQGEEDVKIGLQKGRYPVVDADKIATLQGFVDLALVRWEGTVGQLAVAGWGTSKRFWTSVRRWLRSKRILQVRRLCRIQVV